MTCQHLNFKTISKSAGGSITASASYNQRHKMFDVLENCMKYPHTSASDHVLTKMLLPDGAPEEYSNTEKIWNDLNMIEKDRVGYKMTIAFQKELSFEQNMGVVLKFFDEEFVTKSHPVQISVHRGKNGNTHVHAITSDRRLVNGTWEKTKSETIYYKRGTVKEMDQRGKVINPDAVILTQNDKILQPILKNKKLQYDENGNIIFKKGWKELQYDADGKPLLNDKGEPVLMDIREPEYIPGTNIQQNNTKGKYLEPRWKQGNLPKSNIREIGNINRLRQSAERLFNEAFEKYNILDNNGQRLRISFASYRDQDKELADQLKRTATVHVGYYNEKNNQYAKERLQYNEYAKISNELVENHKTLITKKGSLSRIQKNLAAAKSTTKQQPSPQPKKQQKPESLPKAYVQKTTSPAPTVRPNVAAAVAAKTLSFIDGIAGPKTSAPSGKILRQDDRPMTAADRIIQEYIDDGTGTIDELPNRKPKINALKEWSQALTKPSTDRDQENQKKVAAVLTEEQARSNYKAKAKIRDDSLAVFKKDFIEKRYYDHYLEDSWQVQKLKSTWEKDLEAAEKAVDIMNQNRSWMDKLRGKYYDIPKNKQDELKKLQMEFLVAERQLEKKYPEIRKYPDVPEVKDKMDKFYEKRQANLIINDAKKMGYKDDQELLQKYLNAAAAAKEAFAKISTDPNNPATGRNNQQENQSKTNTAVKKIPPTKTTATEKRKVNRALNSIKF